MKLARPTAGRSRRNSAEVVRFCGWVLAWGGFFVGAAAPTANFTIGEGLAKKYGVHDFTLKAAAVPANPFDTVVTVKFTPPSGAAGARTVAAIYDGEDAWRARVYPLARSVSGHGPRRARPTRGWTLAALGRVGQIRRSLQRRAALRRDRDATVPESQRHLSHGPERPGLRSVHP